jgi:hypothetical protein
MPNLYNQPTENFTNLSLPDVYFIWNFSNSFRLLIMRSRVRFPVLPWVFNFPEGEDSHGDHGVGSLAELQFKLPPGTSYSCITIHLIGTT